MYMANIDNTSKQDKVYSDYGTQKSTKTKQNVHTQLNSDLKTMKIKLDFVSSIIIDKFKNNLDFFLNSNFKRSSIFYSKLEKNLFK